MTIKTNRIKWKGIVLGDNAYINISYVANNDIIILPRAKGVRVRPTSELGGGYLKITVTSLWIKNTRIDLEKAFLDQDVIYDLTVPGTLLITDFGIDINLTDCYLESMDTSGEDLKSASITYSFIKSL